jgi:putative hemolysin
MDAKDPKSTPRRPVKQLIRSDAVVPTPSGKFVYNLLLRGNVDYLLGFQKLNRIYARISQQGLPPGEFARVVFKELGVIYQINPRDLERIRAIQGPVVIVANHPFGGMEALFMVYLLSLLKREYRVIANYLLQDIAEVKDQLILVDPFDGTQSQLRNMAPLKEAIRFLNNGGVIGVFPAGEVAALSMASGKITEPDWNPNIGKLIKKTKATVIPLFFYGTNSQLFHLAGTIHPRLRTALIVREFMYPRQKEIRFKLGQPIQPDKIQSIADPDDLIRFLRQRTYLLASSYQPPSQHPKYLPSILKITRGKRRLEPIIEPIPKYLLEQDLLELEPRQHLYHHNGMTVYVAQAHQIPNILKEIGRLREVTFRKVGEGCGKAIDLDEFDRYYDHLFIWNHATSEVVGAYRMARCDEILKTRGHGGLYINTLFTINPKLFDTVHPALELGRSFVRLEYQRSYWALMMLWIGIGHYLLEHPTYRYLIGPVSISNSFHSYSQNFLVSFLQENHLLGELSGLVKAKHPFQKNPVVERDFYRNLNIKDMKDIQELMADIETTDDARVPTLLKHYLKLGGQILAFNVDPDFQNSLDALIVTDVCKIEKHTLKKYMGDEGYARYMSLHGAHLPDDASAAVDDKPTEAAGA